MEERIIDKEEGRKIKITRTAVGGIQDATEDLGGADETENAEEIIFDIPELDENSDSYDESLVGLTPTQLHKVLEERKKAEEEARVEREKMLAAANEALASNDYKKAEACFVQALLYDPDCLSAKEGIWYARTERFKKPEVVYEKECRLAIENASVEVRHYLKEKAGAFFGEEREKYTQEAQPLSQKVEADKAERREAFAQNKRYYLIRFLAVLAVVAVFAVGAAVSANFIVRTQSITPIVLSGVFGGLCFISLIVFIVFACKLYTASRYCRVNEKLTSTDDGVRLFELNARIQVLDCILNEEE